jgi:hypothetical protein
MTDRSEATKRRAEARDRRRQALDTRQVEKDGADKKVGADNEVGLDVKAAARAAASAAAAGVAASAGRALGARMKAGDGGGGRRERNEPEPNHDDGRRDGGSGDERREPARGASTGDVKAIVRQAREQLEELQGRPVESISGVERTRDGWTIDLEVLELSRIPETTDVLATYEVELDGDGNLRRYTRRRRYHRADAGEQEWS